MGAFEERMATVACVLSTVILRTCSYIFLRWIPGHVFPGIIYTSFATFLTSFAYLYRRAEPYEIMGTESEVSVQEKPHLNLDGSSDEALGGKDKLQLLRQIAAEEPEAVSETPKLELQATERVFLRKKRASPIKSLLGGLPSPTSKRLTLASLLLNFILVLFVTDMTYRPTLFHPSKDLSFARVGYVSTNTARILMREPNPNNLPITVSYREEETGKPNVGTWVSAAEVLAVSSDTDFVVTVTMEGLEPGLTYRYKTSNGHSGRFRTAPPKSHSLVTKNKPTGKFTFLTSSCLKARVPYNPFDHPLAVKGFKYLGDVLRRGRQGLDGGVIADFMLFLGDFIYIDVPRRPSGDAKEGYRMHYRQVYNSPDWAAVGNELPFLHVIDDHEIANDWDGNVTGIYATAMDPFHIYQHSANPPPHRIGETYYTFTHGAAAFFLSDSRRYRSNSRLPDGPGKTFLGAHQLADLLTWIKDDGRDMEDIQWKFFVTSSPFTKNWRFDTTDTWGVYLHERQQILEAMWSMAGKFGFVVLSGDRHEFGATVFPPPNGTASDLGSVYEFSCSPLSQFYLPKRTYEQKDNEDIVLKYIPDGNYKFGAVEVDATNKGSGQAIMKYRLFVDGVEKWDYVLTKDLGSHMDDMVNLKDRRHLWE